MNTLSSLADVCSVLGVILTILIYISNNSKK